VFKNYQWQEYVLSLKEDVEVGGWCRCLSPSLLRDTLSSKVCR
jgi:hypothetical protein